MSPVGQPALLVPAYVITYHAHVITDYAYVVTDHAYVINDHAYVMTDHAPWVTESNFCRLSWQHKTRFQVQHSAKANIAGGMMNNRQKTETKRL
jgi:hypothetical protein